MDDRSDPVDFRREVAAFLDASMASGDACPAYGAILTPGMTERAVAWQRYCYDRGFAGLHWPEQYGGQGLPRSHSAIWHEECARAAVAPYLNLQGIVLAGEAILRAGTEAQKERYLDATLRAELIWCQLFSEPEAGSDLAGLRTAAVRDGDRYLVNGQKVWSSNADIANQAILMARTDPERPAHKGISFFLLDMALDGVEARPLRQMTGDAEFCEVFLTDVPMPADALLGPEHEGWRVAMEVLTDERGSFGAAGAIALNRQLDELVADGRRTAGSGHQRALDRDRLATLMASGTALGQLLGRSTADPARASMAKVLRSELDFAVSAHQLSSLGADAMLTSDDTADDTPDDDAGRHDPIVDRFLYAPGMRIAGGSSEIQRNIIGERLLGLPRGPR